MKSGLLIALALALAACGQSAQTPPPAAETAAPAATSVEISDPWAAVTPNGASVGAGYMTLSAHGGGDKLLSASSPRAGRVEIHEMRMEGDLMQMRQLANGLAIPPDGLATLAPGGAHLMFMDLAAPFVEGETVPVTLTFEHAGAVETSLAVRPMTGGAH